MNSGKKSCRGTALLRGVILTILLVMEYLFILIQLFLKNLQPNIGQGGGGGIHD